MTPGLVTREAFLAQLEAIRVAVVDPRAGVCGPDSVMWQVGRESVVFLGGGRAALMQVAHPFVAQAIRDHSQTEQDLVGRFQRTFLAVFAVVFGDLEEATKAARAVFHVHTHIHGHLGEALGRWPQGAPYTALDPEALLWVHATLVDTAVLVYERCVGPLPNADKDRLCREGAPVAGLFGVPEAILPRTWAAFRAYVDARLASDQIAVGTAAREIAGFLQAPPNRAVAPLWRWYWRMTAGLLPEELRQAYGMPFGRLERAVFGSTMGGLRQLYPRLPMALRTQPNYVEAQRRLAGKEGPTLYGELVRRVVAAGLTQSA